MAYNPLYNDVKDGIVKGHQMFDDMPHRTIRFVIKILLVEQSIDVTGTVTKGLLSLYLCKHPDLLLDLGFLKLFLPTRINLLGLTSLFEEIHYVEPTSPGGLVPLVFLHTMGLFWLELSEFIGNDVEDFFGLEVKSMGAMSLVGSFFKWLCSEHHLLVLFRNLEMLSGCWVRTGMVIPEHVVQAFDDMLGQIVFRIELYWAAEIILMFVLVKNKWRIRGLVKGDRLFKAMLSCDKVLVGNGMWSLCIIWYRVPNARFGDGGRKMPGSIGGCRAVATVLRLSIWWTIVVRWNQMEFKLLAYERKYLVHAQTLGGNSAEGMELVDEDVSSLDCVVVFHSAVWSDTRVLKDNVCLQVALLGVRVDKEVNDFLVFRGFNTVGLDFSSECWSLVRAGEVLTVWMVGFSAHMGAGCNVVVLIGRSVRPIYIVFREFGNVIFFFC